MSPSSVEARFELDSHHFRRRRGAGSGRRHGSGPFDDRALRSARACDRFDIGRLGRVSDIVNAPTLDVRTTRQDRGDGPRRTYRVHAALAARYQGRDDSRLRKLLFLKHLWERYEGGTYPAVAPA